MLRCRFFQSFASAQAWGVSQKLSRQSDHWVSNVQVWTVSASAADLARSQNAQASQQHGDSCYATLTGLGSRQAGTEEGNAQSAACDVFWGSSKESFRCCRFAAARDSRTWMRNICTCMSLKCDFKANVCHSGCLSLCCVTVDSWLHWHRQHRGKTMLLSMQQGTRLTAQPTCLLFSSSCSQTNNRRQCLTHKVCNAWWLLSFYTLTELSFL